MEQQDMLVQVRNLTKTFETRRGSVKAVADVSFDIPKGAIVGLVGESGSGKSTIGRCLLRLIEPTSGVLEFDGRDLVGMGARELRAARKLMQIVFQDPYSSLNPRLRIEQIIGEALDAQGVVKGKEKSAKIAELLSLVGLRPEHASRFPHEFSGGQRQRIGIARALAVNPQFIVADEPVSALDVSVQAQVLNLLQELRAQFGLTMLFISHDLAVVEYLCDYVTVLYLGRVMESGAAATIFKNPAHPYTRALLSAAPVPDPTVSRERIPLGGDIPSPANPPSGCVFRTRCPNAVHACATQVPTPIEVSPGHKVACIRLHELTNRAARGNK